MCTVDAGGGGYAFFFSLTPSGRLFQSAEAQRGAFSGDDANNVPVNSSKAGQVEERTTKPGNMTHNQEP